MDRRIALGQIIGDRYKLIQELGRGSFGTTFIAEDTHRPSNPRCVVKQLTPKVNINSEITERFELEARVLEQLGEHPQIPRLLAYLEENEQFYLVQELIIGRDLREEFKDAPFPEEQVMRLVRDILEVLVFVHQEKNCIHRDIKPSN
jgi:serine/threonine protein kinase